MSKKNFLNKVKTEVSLEEYNTMKIDCVANYFIQAETEDDILFAKEFAKEKKLPFFVLGKGSNVILPGFFKGIVVFIKMDKFTVTEENNKILLSSQAGAYLPDVAYEVTKKKGSGMEWAGGVPGSIGGAVRGNAGAFEDFTGDCIKEVEALDILKKEKRSFTKEECHFNYRESFFKKNQNYIVLEVKMEFPKEEGGEKKYDDYLSYRKERHPGDPSAGSIFKNPEVKEEFFQKHKESEKFKKLGFVPVSFLIQECGLKGKIWGGAQFSEKHPNFIVNKNKATKEDVEGLINLAKKSVKEKFDIDIQEEVDLSVV